MAFYVRTWPDLLDLAPHDPRPGLQFLQERSSRARQFPGGAEAAFESLVTPRSRTRRTQASPALSLKPPAPPYMIAQPRGSSVSLGDWIGYAVLSVILVAGIILHRQPREVPPKPTVSPEVGSARAPVESLLDRLTRQARLGDVISQGQLGRVYYMGLGVSVDNAEAIKWLKLAGEKGDVDAAQLLGFAYASGHGVAIDQAEALRWWRLASSKGDGVSSFRLALAYLDGRGVARSGVEAMGYLRSAAEKGNADAQYFLGFFYHEGRFVEKSYPEAFAWFRKAAVQAHALAQDHVGIMYRDGQAVPADDLEAVKWFNYSVAHGGGAGCFSLAGMYRDGRGVPRDEAKALSLFRQGAMLGHGPSQAELGTRYQEGFGVTRDLVESLAWRYLAAQGESPEAVSVRDAMLRSLTATQIASARLRADAIKAEIAELKANRRRP